MKKTLIALMALAGVACAAEPTPVALWNGFSSTTSGDYSLTISGSTTIENGVLNVVGANTPTMHSSALIDLSDKGLTFNQGFTVAMWVTDFAYGGTKFTPVAMLAIAAEGSSTYAAAGLGLANAKDDKGAFAYSGSANNVALPERADLAVASCLKDSTPDLFVTTFNGADFTMYVNGNAIVSGTAKNFDGTKELVSLSLGSWYNSANAVANEKVHALAIYNSALTADQVRSINIPEPATATLSLLALAGLAARRRRH